MIPETKDGGLPCTPCPNFWECVATAITALSGQIPRVPMADSYSRIEMNKNLTVLIGIMGRHSFSLLIDNPNAKVSHGDSGGVRSI